MCRPSAIVATFLAEQPPHWLKQALTETGQRWPAAPRMELEVQHAADDSEQAKAQQLLQSWMSAMGCNNPTPTPVIEEAVSSSLRSQLSAAALAQEVCRALQVIFLIDSFLCPDKRPLRHALHTDWSMSLLNSVESLGLWAGNLNLISKTFVGWQ